MQRKGKTKFKGNVKGNYNTERRKNVCTWYYRIYLAPTKYRVYIK